MYVGSYAICVLNWNWLLTQDHFVIKHWSQRTHRCSARVVGLEEYSLVLVSRYSTVRSGTLTWREWGLWLEPSITSVGDLIKYLLLINIINMGILCTYSLNTYAVYLPWPWTGCASGVRGAMTWFCFAGTITGAASKWIFLWWTYECTVIPYIYKS